jgi:hypothetical protein
MVFLHRSAVGIVAAMYGKIQFSSLSFDVRVRFQRRSSHELLELADTAAATPNRACQLERSDFLKAGDPRNK